MQIKELIDRLEKLRIELGDETLVQCRNMAGDCSTLEQVDYSRESSGPRIGAFTVLLDS